ncbi:MAG: S9 family peptidase [Rickettsiales bacterium]|nr:S9 family peptidase [Rickettsiales bacterium]
MNNTKPPIATKERHIKTIHGHKIIDDYHWLRDPNWPNVTNKNILSYLKAENKHTDSFFEPLKKETEKIYQEIIGRIKLDDQSVPVKHRKYYYSTITKKNSNYPIYVRKKTSNGKDEIIFDGNKESKGHRYFSIGSLSISPSGKLMAYSIDTQGDERYTAKIRELSSNKNLSDILKNISSIVWDELEQGFFYTKMDEKWRATELYYHKLGTEQKKDKLIYKEQDHTFQIGLHKTSDYKYIIVNISSSTSDEIQYLDASGKTHKLNMLIPRREDHLCSVDHIHNYFYIQTNDKGKNFRLVRVKDNKPTSNNYEEIISHSDSKYLLDIDLYDNFFVIETKEEGLSQIRLLNYNLQEYDHIQFPDQTYTASTIYSCHDDDKEILISYSSLVSPTTIFKYTLNNKKISPIKIQEIPSGYNKEEYKCERVFAKSRDGKTKIPISLVYKKSLFKADGSNPLFLYGYGSYGISISPSFSTSALSFLDRGFVYAIAHIRGGDDLGFKWYEDAKFLNKKLTFNDFIDCAKSLIKENYTSKGNIAISGGSAGGMLIGNVINEEPELFKSAVANVPFVDVLNTMLDDTLPLTPGEFKEWGNPKEKRFFDYIKSYSPYDNVKEQHYPIIYVLAGLNDPRVTYWEPAKWVAKLRDKKLDNNILLLETDMESGHKGKTGRFPKIKEAAKEYSFIFYTFKCL